MWRTLQVIAAAASVAGCYAPDLGDGDLTCGPGRICPDDYGCDLATYRCVQGARLLDGGVPDPVDGSEPDGAPPPDAPRAIDGAPPPADAPLACGWYQLLSNSDFDLGHNAWSETPPDAIITNGTFLSPQSGDWWAKLGGSSNLDLTLWQAFDIPSTATQLRLSGFRCFVKSDGADGGDYLTIALEDMGGSTLETLASYGTNDADTACGWAPFTLQASNAYAGQPVALEFKMISDASYVTTFHVDSLLLEVYACL